MRNLLFRYLATAVALAMVITTVALVANEAGPTPAHGAPGTPGVPKPGVTVSYEDFENAMSLPVSVLNYRGSSASGKSIYTAHPSYLPGANSCNGWVMSAASPVASEAGCYRAGNSGWAINTVLAKVIGQAQGMDLETSMNNGAWASATNQEYGTQEAGTVLDTVSTSVTSQPGRFYSIEAYIAAVNCNSGKPAMDISLTFEDHSHKLLTGFSPCGNAIPNFAPGSNSVYVSNPKTPAVKASVAEQMGVRFTNTRTFGSGNDFAIDGIRIVDVTPALDHTFTPAVIPVSGSANWTFTITNTAELAAKTGWTFSVPMPAGMTTQGAPTTTCSGGAATVSSGVLSVVGNLLKDQVSCTVTVPVTSTENKVFTVPGTAFTVDGVTIPGDASLTMSSLTLAASANPTGISKSGAVVNYTFTVTNPSTVAVSGLTVTAAGPYTGTTSPGFSGAGSLGAITCDKTSIPAGGSTTCHAAYTTTTADLSVEQINLTARASATAAGALAPTVSHTSSATVAVLKEFPSISHGFVPSAIPVNGTSTLTYTIHNSTNMTAKTGWSFAVMLPAGVTATGTATTNCPGGSASMGGNRLTGSGNLNADQLSCTVTVPVTTAANGTYTIQGSAVTATNAEIPTSAATLSTSQLAMTASVDPSTVGGAGGTTDFVFEVTNTGTVAVNGVTITAEGPYTDNSTPGFSGTGMLGSIVCDQTAIAAGGSTTCRATYSVSQNDMNLGKVFLTAQASATGEGAETTTRSNLSSATLSLVQTIGLSGLGVNEPTMTDANQQVTFEFEITNNSTFSVTDLFLLPVDFSGTGTAPVLSCAQTTLVAKETTICSGTYTTTADDVGAKHVILSVEAAAGSLAGTVMSAQIDSNLTLVAGTPVALESSLSVDHTSAVFGTNIVATVLVRDKNLTVVPDVEVSFTVTGQGDFGGFKVPQQSTTCTTNAAGVCSVTLTSRVVEKVTLSAEITVGTSVPVTGSGMTLSFLPGPVDAMTSSMSADPLSLHLGEYVTVTGTARDSAGNPITGERIYFLTDGEARFTNGSATMSCVTDATGTCTAKLTSLVEEDIEIVGWVLVAGVPAVVTGSGISVNYHLGVAAGENSTITAIPDTTVVGGAGVKIAAVIEGAHGHVIHDVTVTFHVTGKASFGSLSEPQVTTTTCNTDENGECDVTLNSLVAEKVYVSATISPRGTPETVVGSGLGVTFTPGEIAAWNSTLEVDRVVAYVDDPIQATATVRDEYDNPISNAVVDFEFKDLPDSCTTDASGTCSITITSSEPYSGYLSSEIGSETIPNTPVQLEFVERIPDAGYSTLSVNRTLQTIGAPVIVTVTSRNPSNELLPYVDVFFSVDGSATFGPYGTLRGPTATCRTGEDATCSVTLTDAVIETVHPSATVMVSGNPETVSGSGVDVSFMVGDPVPAAADFSVNQFIQTVNEQIIATIAVWDQNGFPIVGMRVLYADRDGELIFSDLATSTPIEACYTDSAGMCVIQVTRTTPGMSMMWALLDCPLSEFPVVVPGSQVDLEFVNLPEATTSEIHLDRDTQTVGKEILAEVTIRDFESNPIPNVDVTLTLSGDTATFGAVGAPRQATTTCTTSAPDDADRGTCQVSFTNTMADEVEISASISIAGVDTEVGGNGDPAQASPLTARFTPGEFSHSKSTVTVTPVINPGSSSTWVKADGVDYYLVTLFASDQFGNTIVDLNTKAVDFTASTNDVMISGIVDHKDGSYTSAMVSVVADSRVTASVFYQSSQVGTPRPIPFRAGDPVQGPVNCLDSSKSGTSATATPSEVVAGGASSVSVLVTDAFCNPVQGVPVTFTPSGYAMVSNSSRTTNSAGRASVTVTDLVAQVVTVTVAIPDGEVNNSPVPITFLPDAFDENASSFEVFITDSAATHVIADGVQSWTGQLTARDNKANLITDLNVNDLDFFAPSDVKVSSVSTNGRGVYRVTYTSTLTGDHLVGVTHEGAEVGNEETISFVAGPVSSTAASFIVSPDTQTVGKSVTVILTINDTYGNPVLGLRSTDFRVTGTSEVGHTLSISTFREVGLGVYTFRASATFMGDYEVQATVTDVTLSDTAIVTYVADQFSATESAFTVSPVADMGDYWSWMRANNDDSYVGTLWAKDQFGNPVSDLDIDKIAFIASSDSVTVSEITDHGNGQYSVEFTTKVADATHAASAYYNEVLISRTMPIPFRAGDPVNGPVVCEDPTKSPTGVYVYPTQTVVGSYSSVIAHLADAYCNPIIGAPAEFYLNDGSSATLSDNMVQTSSAGNAAVLVADNVAETVAVKIMLPCGEIEGSPVSIDFIAGDLDASQSSFEVYITDVNSVEVLADGVQSWTGRLVARDTQGNLLEDLEATDLAFAASSKDVAVSTVTNHGGGVYTVTYTSTQDGSFTVSLSYLDTPVGSPATISFMVGDIADAWSRLTVPHHPVTVGTYVTVTVVTRDGTDHPITGLTDSDVIVTGKPVFDSADEEILESGDRDLPGLTIGDFQEVAPGVYTMSATTTIAGEYILVAVVNGFELTTKPTVTFVSGGVCVSMCDTDDETLMTRFEMVTNDQLADGQAQVTAIAYAYDSFGNPVKNASVIVEDKTSGALAGALTPSSQTWTTSVQGTATVFWTSTKAGVFTAQGTINGLRPTTTGVMDQIRFTTGAANAAKSSLVVTPDSPIKAGNSYTATVTVRDVNENLVQDAAVAFTLAPTSPAQLSAAVCITGTQGTCSVSVVSDAATAVAIHATLPMAGKATDLGGNSDSSHASPQTVEFIAGDVCVAECTAVDSANVTRVEVIEDGLEANGSTSALAKVFVYDRLGNPVSSAVVTSVTSDSALSIVAPIAPTGADGTTVIEYRSTVAGGHIATAAVNGATILKAISSDGTESEDGEFTLYFASGAANSSHSTLSIDPQRSQVVGSSFTVTADVRDVHDNAVSNAVIAFPEVEDLSFSDSGCVTQADGTCSVTVTTLVAGSYTIAGLLALAPIPTTVTAVFTADEVCVSDCNTDDESLTTRVVVTTNGQEADGISWNVATVYVYDTHGNPVPGAIVESTPTTGAKNLTIQSDIAPTAANGITTIWYTSTVKGSYTADVSVNGRTPSTSPITMTFANGNGDILTTSWVITPASPLPVGEGTSSRYTATATVLDSTGNAVPGGLVTFALSASGPQFVSGATCTTDDAGECSVTIQSTLAGTYSVTASIAAGAILNADTGLPAASIAW
ncbi:MAG: Ig-like domain-containing protein, partial [Propionibacteriaceae bacterium]|nr:Ig-like domain-containing protein [Propionibacteriaceae bacterium]